MIKLSPSLSFLIQTPDFSKIIEGLKEILKLIFGEQIPTWILPVAGYVLLAALILAALLGLLITVVKIKDLFKSNIWPMFYNKEKVRRSNRRRKFADHIESELRRLNNLEAWSDYRFTELEAEVDAEGRRRLFGILPSIYRTGNTLRRETSLSKALKSSDERLIVVEGEPGSGKSVALRHVASLLAARAMRSRSIKSLIPIYVNLKEIERKKLESIDRNLIESFVLKVLNRVNDRDVEEFLDEEFRDGLKNGTWFFLFDSFDEIPEVLSSTEADKSIREYATAISDFLHGLNECRGVIASRFFHGPKQFGWPRFRILPLTSARKLELIRKADLSPIAEGELIGQLDTAPQEINLMATNPMFLGLLCEHMHAGYPFPDNSHTVLDTYIDSRFTRDKERLFKRFKLEPQELRAVAEAAAFCMAADSGLGLSPKRENIKAAAQKLDIKLGKQFDKTLDALTYLKLSRADTSTTTDKSEQFTFAHRRFQEYFATAVVLREPERVTVTELLLDARWRETAVVMCQTQPQETLSSFLEEAERLVSGFVETSHATNDPALSKTRRRITIGRFTWPPHALHVLGLIQDGFTRRLNILSDAMRGDIGAILTTARRKGITADAKWGLDVAGTAPPRVLAELLRAAFNDRSQVLRDSAYRQIAKLNNIPSDLAFSIRATLTRMTLTGRLRKERTATYAHLSRLTNPSNFLATLRLLLWLPTLDLAVHILLLLIMFLYSFVLWFQTPNDYFSAVVLLLAIVFVPITYLSFYSNVNLVPRLVRLFDRYANDAELYRKFSFISLFFNRRTWLVITTTYIPIVVLVLLLRRNALFSDLTIPKTYKYIVLTWVYLSLWAPSAVSFSIQGRFLNLAFWPIFPLLALAILIRKVVIISTRRTRGIKGFLTRLVEDWKEMLMTGLQAIGLLCGLYLALGLVGLGIFWTMPYSGIIIGVALGVLLVIMSAATIRLWIADLMKWRNWRKSKQSALSSEEFITCVRSYNFHRSQVRFISTVRTKGLLLASHNTEEAIYNFAREIELQTLSTDQPSVADRIVWIATSIVKQMRRLIHYESENSLPKNEYEYGVGVLDEVLRLLEQIRTAA